MELIAKFGLYSGSLVLLLVLGYSFHRSVNNIFLFLSLFFVWYSLLTVRLSITGQILQYPYLERTGIIAAYLSCPFFFIYSRNTFYPGRLWKISDWIFLLPAFVYIIDFMPFFLMSSQKKNAIWIQNLGDYKKMLQANEGWLGSSGFYFAFSYVWIFVIMYLQFQLIASNWVVKTGFRSNHNRRLLYFILIVTVLYLPLFVPGIFGVLFELSWFNPQFIAFTFGLSLFCIAIYLLIYPNILYGFLPEVKDSFRTANEVMPTEISARKEILTGNEMKSEVDELSVSGMEVPSEKFTAEEIPPELATVVGHMEHEKPYRKQGFTIQDLSNQTGIPVYQLSPLINRYFKLNFTTWVNRYRVDYFIKHTVRNNTVTLEALAKDAGFTSRSTFIGAFKKEKGVTPREYLRKLTS